ncbi:ElaB/YqjD/DUF883 family membrane-anchored ribosome-binding protein [Achromobacter deleyi]|uniref:hypothetical protein n=1 Tax=Achromobacter deleyi TaxID=1353891 RepID=UPI0028627CF7|nr:hypothetical protein [Achromobacter deleyi]MDR6600220.1 ElaB/YqjD/DUF883 family membrane-anchored ribosome-binding protein [Achromobacter deleyi]
MKNENEFITLYLQNETSKIRIELLQEHQKLRDDLEGLRTKNSDLLSEINNNIKNTESKIVERAIEKTLEIIHQIKSWLGIAAISISAIVGFGVLLGYKNLNDTLTASFKDEVAHWMRFDDEHSGGRKALDELRTEALVNAYMIRLARNYSKMTESLFPLNSPAEKRLLEILQAPNTKYSDFSDVLTIIIKNRGPFRLMIPEDGVGKTMASLLSKDEISPEKKGLLLNRMTGEEALLPHAKSILNDENQNIFVRIDAFENVKKFDRDTAIAFAQKNVKTINPRVKGLLILYLAEVTQDYGQALLHIKELITQKNEYWDSDVLYLASHLAETLPPTVDPGTYKLADIFVEVLRLGGEIDISDERFGPKQIGLRIGGAYSSLQKPGRLFRDSALIKSIILKHGTSLAGLAKSTKFFQLSDKGILLSTLVVKPTGQSSVETQSGFILDEQNVLSEIWFRTHDVPGGIQLTATWRDKGTGVVSTDPVRRVNKIDDMNFELSFDDKVLQALSYDYRSPTDWL